CLEEGVRIEAPSQILKLLRLRQITGGFVSGRKIGSSTKLQALTELVTSHDEQFVVVAEFKDEIQAIHRELSRHGIPCEVIHGGISGPQRDKIVERFQKGKELR